MKITVIIENKTYREGLVGQYGLSLYVETSGGTLLLDAGSDQSAYLNFLKMGFNANQIDAIVVSHNHFDHFGGVSHFIDACTSKVYISDNALKENYVKIPFCRKALVSRCDIIEKYSDRFVYVNDQLEILPGVFLCRIKQINNQYLCQDKKLKQLSDHKLVPDDFSHEIYVAILENNECKILSSCSHNGIVNIVNDAMCRFEGMPIVAFVGGLHMRKTKSNSLNCSRKHAENIFTIVEQWGVRKIFTGHCTGKKAYEILKETTQMETYYFSTGDVFDL